MPDLTETEYDALDELWTNNPPEVSGDGKSGFFLKHRNEIVIDEMSEIAAEPQVRRMHRICGHN